MSETTTTEQYEQAPVQQDYFGFSRRERFWFPDHATWIDFEVMNEGKKSKYQRETQRDLVIERGSGNARTKVDPAAARHALIEASIVDWNLVRAGRPVPYQAGQPLRDFLQLADPRIVEDLEKAIRKANPWLLDEMSVADIDREIDNLKEMRAVAEEREQGEASSASK